MSWRLGLQQNTCLHWTAKTILPDYINMEFVAKITLLLVLLQSTFFFVTLCANNVVTMTACLGNSVLKASVRLKLHKCLALLLHL